MVADRPYLWRTLPDGTRQIGWRSWVLVWVLPALLCVAGAAMLLLETYRVLVMERSDAEVVRVYAWDGDTLFDRGKVNYSPVLRYVWTDGNPTEATPGMSHPSWNFEIGSIHQIRYMPKVKTNVMLVSPVYWYAPLIVAALGVATSLPAGVASMFMLRWRRGGAR